MKEPRLVSRPNSKAEEIFDQRNINSNRQWLGENLKNIKVVYVDLDNTLLGPGGSLFLSADKKYTLEPAKAIIEAERQNLDIVITSGRSRRQLFGDARILGFKNYIAELGCQLVYDGGDDVRLNIGRFEVREKTVYETITKSGAPELLFDNFKGRLEYHTPWSEGRECTHVLRGFIDLTEANKILEKHGLGELKVVDNGAIYNKGNLKDLEEIHAYHLLPMAADKASGGRKDKVLRKIRPENAIALGVALSVLILAPEVMAMFVVRNGLQEDSKMAPAILNYQNVFITEGEMGLGFAEIIELLKE